MSARLVSTLEIAENNQINNLLFAIISTFLICNCLDVTYRVLEIFNVYPYIFDTYVVHPFSDFLLSVNALTNACYFCLYGRQFRATLKKLIRCHITAPSSDYSPGIELADAPHHQHEICQV